MAEIYRALLACVSRSLPDSGSAGKEYLTDSHCPDAVPACWQLTVSMLSGKEAKLSLSSKAAVSELASMIEEALQVPTSRQELVLPSGGVLLTPGGCEAGGGRGGRRSLAEAGLSDGDRLTVLHVSWLPPRLPPKLSLTLTSVRERVFPHYSSAFVICYEIEVDQSAGRVDVKLWRKNDHDTRSYNLVAGTVEGSHQHWMTGSTPFAHKLHDTAGVSLEQLLQRWLEKPTPVVRGERFWQKPCPKQEEGEEDFASSYRRRAWSAGVRRVDEEAWPMRRPQWFEVPEVGDFVELQVDLPFFNGRRLGRVLVDASGMPVRAAIIENYATPMHDAVEEFDVKWKEM